MNAWKLRAKQWLVITAGFGGAWGLAYVIGIYLVPTLDPLDRAISAFVNPDAYVPVLDEIFRAYTDYGNFLIATPLISLAIAIGLYRLSQMPQQRAAIWGALTCAIWAFVAVLLRTLFELNDNVTFAIAAVAPALVLLGVLPPKLYKRIHPKRWITAILILEAILLLAAWVSQNLMWNKGLVGANYVFLPLLLLVFGGSIYVFHVMDDGAKGRFIRVFWMVLLTVLLVDFGATDRTKESVGRPRPLSEKNSPWNEGLRAIPDETLRGANSYPSGHTSGTFALITPLFWWFTDPRVRFGLLGLGVLQAVSRVYTVAHFMTDVVVGALLGFGVGTLIFFVLDGPRHRKPPVGPPDSGE